MGEDLPVVGSGGKLGKANCCSLGQYTALAKQLLIVRFYLVVLLAHAGHPERALVYEILEHIDVVFELLEVGILLNFLEVGELHNFVVVDLHSKVLHTFGQHVVVLGQVLQIVLQFLYVRFGPSSLEVQLGYSLLQFCDVPVLLFGGMVFIEGYLAAHLLNHLVLILQLRLQLCKLSLTFDTVFLHLHHLTAHLLKKLSAQLLVCYISNSIIQPNYVYYCVLRS